MQCVFCKITNGEIPAKILSETSHSMSFLDAFPLSRGHVLVIPKNHCERIQDLSADESADLFSLVHRMISRVDRLAGATLVAIHNGKGAGQEIPHMHVHMVPRYAGDSAGAIHSMFGSATTLSDYDAVQLYEMLKD